MRAGDILPGMVNVMLQMLIGEEMYTIYTLRTIILKRNTKNDEKECGLRIHHSPAWLRSELNKQPNSHSSTSKLFAARRAQNKCDALEHEMMALPLGSPKLWIAQERRATALRNDKQRRRVRERVKAKATATAGGSCLPPITEPFPPVPPFP